MAFIGDQGTKDTSGAVLDMLLQEGVEAIVHMGDFDYIDNPTRWDEFLDEHLPPNFPYFAAIGCVSFLANRYKVTNFCPFPFKAIMTVSVGVEKRAIKQRFIIGLNELDSLITALVKSGLI